MLCADVARLRLCVLPSAAAPPPLPLRLLHHQAPPRLVVTRSRPSLSTVPLHLRRSTAARHVSMFKKAVDAHNSRAGDAFKPVAPVPPATQKLGVTPRNDALRAKSRFVLNEPSAVKRTSSGLAKGTSGDASGLSRATSVSSVGSSTARDAGSSTARQPGSQHAPIDVDQQRIHVASKPPGVFFDENDFDEDDDSLLLAAEKLTNTSTVTYPKLTLSPANAAVLQPRAKRDFHSQASDRNEGGSVTATQAQDVAQSFQSDPWGWSSSPAEHYRSPKKVRTFGSPTRTDVGPNLKRERPSSPTRTVPGAYPTEEAVASVQPVAKKRKLPWSISEEHEQDEEAVSTPQPRRTENSVTKSSPSFPWNTSASAVKEQQKLLRKTNASKKQNTLTSFAKPATSKTASHKAKHVAPTHLSPEQKLVLDYVVEQENSVFFTGSAGTGKSVLLREIIAALKLKFARETDRVAVTASTGLAACNIGGVTLHSFAGIGLGKESIEDLSKKVKRNQKAKQRWMRTKYLVIDEVSMVDGDLFDKLEELARRIRNNSRSFGGIKLVVTGDFFQLPPVAERGGISKFSFDAKSWPAAVDHTIALHTVFRQKDPVFAAMLNEMREGSLSSMTVSAFRKLARPLQDSDDLAATELFPTRNEVEGANNNRMSLLHGKPYRFTARDGGTLTDKVARDRLLQNCMAPETLELKKGAQVMLIKNIDDTLVNGSLGKVVGFMTEAQWDLDDGSLHGGANDDAMDVDRFRNKNATPLASTVQLWPKVRFAVADGTTRDLLVQPESWKVELPNGEVQASRAQVPLILAWALSIHKAQGQTLERVKVDLARIFEKGQAYVALSRATSTGGLQVLNFDVKKVFAHDRVRDFYAQLARADGATGGGHDDD